MRYKEVNLGELVSFVSKGIPPKYIETKSDNTIVVLNQRTNRNFQIDYSLSRLNDLSKKKVPTNKILIDYDILINSTGVGTAGRVAQLVKVPELTTVDGHMIIVRPDEEKIDPLYLGYAIKAQQVKIEGLQEGTTGQTELNRQRLLHDIIIQFPESRKLQQDISRLFFLLDEKIENNKKINHHLEQMAQAIFKSWFIDFDPFGGEKPSDWKTANLTDIAEYLNGLAMQKYRPLDNEESLPVLKIKELRQGIFDSSSDLCSADIKSPYIIQDGDIIFSWSGSLLVDFWTGGVGGLNQHLFKVSSQEYDKWFYYSWTKHYLDEFIAIAADKATTMGHITRKSLEKAEILIPNDHDYKSIGLLLAPTYNQIISNRIENRKLMEVRNSLLPKLLSGEIPVNQATK
ncbi:restriction endonuclease subunit S [Streptococcus sinensis]|uniref:restriction endonuclease subunit S n=1 Tax=Streptococcus sinensis TaxID=176090 RepID=UPI00272A7BF2|nr:restriction endonuclease subunit S [Streptococcus sinensis]